MSDYMHPTWTMCANCERWAGQRQISRDRDHVEVENQDVKGECVGGAMNGNQTGARSSCNMFQKWSALA
jgi:hypothetical protein